MAWANTYLNDRHNPWISSPRPADKDWTDDSATATHQVGTVRAQDAGLGVNRITLTGAADGTKTVTASCSGDPQRAPCPLDWPMDLPSYRLDEGVNTLGLQNTDIVDNVGDAQTWTEKIDRTAPTITDVGGPLRDAAGGTVRRGSYDLHVDASDGVPGGTVRQRRSGGKQIIVRVSDAAGERTARSAVRSCPIDSCELHENVTVPAEVLGGPGEKTISVTATDQLNHESDPAAQRFLLTVDDGLGERAQYTFVDEEVSPRLRVGVNVANGNLLIRETDYEIRETGIDIAQRRYYNSQATGTGAYGAGWSALGRDMRVATLSDGSVRLEDSTGYHAVFSRQTDGSFTAPRGTDAEIQRIGDAYRLGFRASEETLDFPLNGPMQRQTDSTGEAISFTYAADGSLSSVRHSDGAEVGTAANADGRTASAQTPAGQHTYVYDGPTLVRHTDPVLGATSYTYDSSTGLLRVVDSVDGHADITYDANDRVKTLTTRRGPSGQPTQTVTFDYPSAEMATATLVDGATTTYTVDHNAFVTLSRSGTNPPAVELGGSLKDRDGTLLEASTTYALDITGHPTGSEALTGVVATTDGAVELDAEISCGSACSQASRSLTFATAEQGDGEHAVRATVTNSAGGETTRSVYVRTRPVAGGDVPEEPGATEDEAVQHDKDFRSRYGLNADDTYVREARTAPTAKANENEYGAPLYPAELSEMQQRDTIMSKLDIVETFGTTHASDSYAGYYVDHAAGGLIYVGFTASGLLRFEELKQQFPYPDKLRMFTAVHPQTALQSTLDAVNAALTELHDSFALATVNIDSQRNAVVIGLPAPNAVLDAQLKLRFGLPIVLEQSTATELDRTTYRKRIQAGLRIRQGSARGLACTSGYSVRKKIPKRTLYRLLTAGHCGDHQWYFGGVRFGETVALSPTSTADAQTISLRYRRISNRIYFNPTFSRRVDHVESIASEEKKGQTVCFSGIKNVTCGELIDRDTSYCDDDSGACYTKQRKTKFGARPGDSGAPVYRKLPKGGAIAVGLLSGSESVLGVRERMFYSHAERVERALNVEICTTRTKC